MRSLCARRWDVLSAPRKCIPTNVGWAQETPHGVSGRAILLTKSFRISNDLAIPIFLTNICLTHAVSRIKACLFTLTPPIFINSSSRDECHYCCIDDGCMQLLQTNHQQCLCQQSSRTPQVVFTSFGWEMFSGKTTFPTSMETFIEHSKKISFLKMIHRYIAFEWVALLVFIHQQTIKELHRYNYWN